MTAFFRIGEKEADNGNSNTINRYPLKTGAKNTNSIRSLGINGIH